jgi:uncharacterized protein YgbK (DUF1537 family)
MGPAFGIIADDFTGALMVAGYLEEAGIYCPVVFDAAAVDEVAAAPVVVLAGRTRTIPVAEALAEARRLADALDAIGCARVAYKACASFDSTEAGNIGPIADLLADRYGRRPVLMSAGFPEFACTVHQGYLFYRGRLVSESIKRLDPLTPMSDPDLARFLGRQTPHQVGLVAHATLCRGLAEAERAVDRLAAEGCGHVLFDTTDDRDAAVSAQVAARRQAVVAASDPMIVALAGHLVPADRRSPPPAPRRAAGPAAVLVGSVGPVAEAQLASFGSRHPVLRIDVSDGRADAAVVASGLDWAGERIGAAPFAVTTAADAEGVARAQAAMTAVGAARRAERLLGAVAAGLAARGVRRFVVSGGETSGAVVAALGVRRVRSLPRGPFGTGFCVSEAAEPTALYLKPGKLGADDVLLAALAAMDPDGR